MIRAIGAWLAARGIRGGGRILRWAVRQQSLPLLPFRAADGLTLHLDPRSDIDAEIIRHGTHEPKTLATLLSLMNESSVLWDIGANLGFHALSAKRAWPAATVCAFEASPIVFSQLLVNRKANRLDVQSFCVGLASERGYKEFSIADFGRSSHSSFKPWTGVDYRIRVTTPCDTGDLLVARSAAPQPTIVKIDVEGYEEEVFKGMQQVLASRALKHVVFEADRDLLNKTTLPPAAQILVSNGFFLREIDLGESNFLAERR